MYLDIRSGFASPSRGPQGRVHYVSIDETSDEMTYLVDHGTNPSTQGTQLAESLLKHSREREEAQGVPCGRSIEDDHRVLHRLDVSISHQSNKIRCSRCHGRRTHFMISAKLMASSTPGMANARSCIILPIIPFESAFGMK